MDDATWNEQFARWKQWRKDDRHPDVGDIVSGKITFCMRWGMGVDIGEMFRGHIDVINLGEPHPHLFPDDYPQIGSIVEAVIVDLPVYPSVVWLSLRQEDFLLRARWEAFRAHSRIGDVVIASAIESQWPDAFIRNTGHTTDIDWNYGEVVEGGDFPEKYRHGLDPFIFQAVVSGYDDHLLRVLLTVDE